MSPILASVVPIPDQYQVMLNNYATIVEKTNNQLGLWSNPYGLSIGILTALIAIGAVIVSILLWKNSKDQKDLFKSKMDEQEKLLRENIEDQRKEYDALIEEYKQKLSSAVDGSKKDILEKILMDLKREKASIGLSGISMSGVTGPIGSVPLASSFVTGAAFGITKSIFCINCGREFKYFDNALVYRSAAISTRQVHCSFCGAANLAQ